MKSTHPAQQSYTTTFHPVGGPFDLNSGPRKVSRKITIIFLSQLKPVARGRIQRKLRCFFSPRDFSSPASRKLYPSLPLNPVCLPFTKLNKFLPAFKKKNVPNSSLSSGPQPCLAKPSHPCPALLCPAPVCPRWLPPQHSDPSARASLEALAVSSADFQTGHGQVNCHILSQKAGLDLGRKDRGRGGRAAWAWDGDVPRSLRRRPALASPGPAAAPPSPARARRGASLLPLPGPGVPDSPSLCCLL